MTSHRVGGGPLILTPLGAVEAAYNLLHSSASAQESSAKECSGQAKKTHRVMVGFLDDVGFDWTRIPRRRLRLERYHS